ncbi:MAG: ABC transporter ATP-binding protein [Desulfobacteraceae bacterium]|nr:ABC transporter ATP-binding protein [Desulfobacteraceae bacterium]MBC2754588.1 ABC transporter ATP-binding protein [Desulfobacteraceae bacterium]
MTNPIIEVSHLYFSYNGAPVLSDVSLSIREKEFVAFIGPNGGGKTTLIKLLLGILKPDCGTIKIMGQPPAKVAHRIGYVPQDVSINKSFPISVMDVVLMGRLQFHRWSRLSKKDGIAAKNALESLEMLKFQNRKIDDLSGGQRERVFIARALATDPDILFLDEPTANIDSQGRTDLYLLLKELNKTKTIFVVSHDTMVLSSYVTSVACVNKDVHYHDAAEITEEMMDMGYHCPVEIIAHGIPHRILKTHGDK